MAELKVGGLAVIIGAHCECMNSNIGKVVTCRKRHDTPAGFWWTVWAPEGEFLCDHFPMTPFTIVHEIAFVKEPHLMSIDNAADPEGEALYKPKTVEVEDNVVCHP